MPSRLSLGTEAALLPEVPVPRAEGWYGLWRVVGQVLAYLGHEYGYADLMAASGAAFAWLGPCRVVGSRRVQGGRGAGEVLRLAMGLKALGFPRAQVLEGPAGLPGEEIERLVREETDQGRPVVARGWAPAARGLAVLAGCAPGGLVCGYPEQATAGEPYLAAPASAELLIALGPPSLVAGADVFAGAVRAARACWEEERPGCADGYRAWLHLLTVAPASARRVPADLAEALGALLEARSAAHDFVTARLGDLPDLSAAWAERAADRYGRLLDLLEPLAAEAAGPGALVLWAQEEWRDSARERLEAGGELDAQALGYLRRAAEADYAPEEEVFEG